MSISNSNGMVFIELPLELAEFLVNNCNSNIEMGLKLLDPLGPVDLQRPQAEDVVGMMEKFKIIKGATERAMR